MNVRIPKKVRGKPSTTMTVDELRQYAAKRKTAKKSRHLTKAEYAAKYAMTPPRKESSTEIQQQRALFDTHLAATLTFRVGLPPSQNHHWVPFVPKGWTRSVVYLSSEGEAFIDHVRAIWIDLHNGKPPEPLTGRIRLLSRFSFRTTTDNDISNRIKPLEDALVKAGVILNDEQIDDNRQLRGPIHHAGYADLWIEVI